MLNNDRRSTKDAVPNVGASTTANSTHSCKSTRQLHDLFFISIVGCITKDELNGMFILLLCSLWKELILLTTNVCFFAS